ncbi:SusC/RagA family TonB-linked outer membrane protein [Paraflavitalea devenefica]|uniref:SusC/RagA family TonB-linked outer membrane protein n=1 Tax=Paraflavitalea devenefica TaxID=2716334 RepID=UPI001FE5734F|nr:SusC/RagA family TonB-linked outer membrane protein [Paraflavitalea devenefica]
MFRIKALPAVISLLLVTTVVQAQQKLPAEQTVTGNVRDAATGKPMTGARISYGKLYAAISDSAGNFSMKVPDYHVVIRIDADGYEIKEQELRGRGVANIVLYSNGYNTYSDDIIMPLNITTGRQLTSAAGSVQTAGNWSAIADAPDAWLQGKVAGLQAIRRSGTPNTGAELLMRGFNSLYATNQPLVVVDGAIFDIASYGNTMLTGFYTNPLAYIDMKDVDNITVIKDGGSLYGTRGANGVILITTARARQEATRIEAGLYGGINFAPSRLPVMNAADYRTYLSEMLQLKGLESKDIDALPYMNDDKNNPSYYRNHYDNNWQDKIFENSYFQNAYLKITGGDNIAKYALSMGYLGNNGVISNTGLTRLNMRFNADLNLSPRLTAGANLSVTRNEQKLKNLGINSATNPIYISLVKAPFFAANQVADNGIESPALADRDTFNVSNPMAIISNVQATSKNYRWSVGVHFKYKLTNEFSVSTLLNLVKDEARQALFIPANGIIRDTLSNAVVKNRSGNQVIRYNGFYNDTRLSFDKTYHGIHRFAANLGFRYNTVSSEVDYGLGYNSATDEFTGVGYGLNSLRVIGGSLGQSRWVSTYLNAEYNLRSKYFLSLNLASDASSKFGDHITNGSLVRWGNNSYPLMSSLAAAWVVSSESFMAGQDWLSLLKLRASVGQSGNEDIGNFTARKYYTSQNLLGIQGLVVGNPGNPALQWETVTKLNAGADMAVWNERLNLSVDVFRHKTDNMIVYQPAPGASGFNYTVTNSGALKNTGWELSANGRILNRKDLKWDVGVQVSHYKTVVTKLPVESIITSYAEGTMITAIGTAPNAFYGYKTNGVFSSDAAAAASGLSNKKADGTATAFTGGDIRFTDRNSDHLIDENDRQLIGNPNPDYTGAFTSALTWKNWTLNLLFTFSQGNDIYNYARRQLESMSDYSNQTGAVINRWRTNGQVTAMPKAAWGDPSGNSRFSDRWIEDGSYLRLRTLSIAYAWPLKQGFLRDLVIYASGNNLFTLTKYKGYDPEFSAGAGPFAQGTDVMLEPQHRSLQAGIKLGL